MYHSVNESCRGQLLRPSRFQGLNSGHQTGWQVPLSPEPSNGPWFCFVIAMVNFLYWSCAQDNCVIIGQLLPLLGIEPGFRVQVREKRRFSENLMKEPSYTEWALFNLGCQEAAGPCLQTPV